MSAGSGEPSIGVRESPPGLDIEYNHDLNVSEDFLRCYPAIRKALNDERLLERFDYYDREAKKHKRNFQGLGLGALILGLIPLLVAALRMAVGEPPAWQEGFSTFAEAAGLVSVGLVLWSRFRRHRRLWCQAVFCRERLRQWHFQKFLDGRLIGLLASQSGAYDEELSRRWGELTQNLRDGYGMMKRFLDSASRSSDLFHELTPYSDPAIAEQVFKALWTLRLEHQLRYGKRKTAPQGEQAGLSLEERKTISETAAIATLALAVLVSGSAFIVAIVGPRLGWETAFITRCLGASALFLAVLSAGSRAYRAGYTVPDESESYEEYCDRIREIEAVFQNATSEEGKLRQLKYLEEESAAELRRFLRMKERATFVF